MTLPAKLSREDHAKLDPVLQKEYVEKAGALVLDVAPVSEGDSLWALEDVAGLKKNLQDYRKKHDNAIAYNKRFGEVTPEKLEEMQAELERLKAIDPNAKTAEVRKQVEEQVTKKFGSEIATRDASIADLTRQLEKHVVVGNTRAAIAKHVKVPEMIELILPHVLSRVGSKRGADGTFVPFVKAKDGTEAMTAKGVSTDPMPIEELVESMKTDPVYAPVFTSSGLAGSGARGSNGAGGSSRPMGNQDLPPVERLKIARRTGG